MRRMPIRHRRSFPPIEMPRSGLRGISRDFSRLFPCGGQVAYVLLTRAPVAARSQQADSRAAPRLACVKPVASVHPEPGSNSSLLYLVFFLFFLFEKRLQTCYRERFAFLVPLPSDARFIVYLSWKFLTCRGQCSQVFTFPCLSLLSMFPFRNHFKDL